MKNSKKLAGRKSIPLPLGLLPKRPKYMGYLLPKGKSEGINDNFQEDVGVFDNSEDKIQITDVIFPIVERSLNDLETKVKKKRVISIAQLAAKEAIKRHKITLENLEEKRQIINNYVEYGLFLGEVSGTGKVMPPSQMIPGEFIDDRGELNYLKILNKEEKEFGVELTADEKSYLGRKVVEQESKRIWDTKKYSHLNGIHFITRRLRENIKNSELDPRAIYEVLTYHHPEIKETLEQPEVSLETALATRKVIGKSSDKNLHRYCSETGLYFLARDINQITCKDVFLPSLHKLIKTKDHLISILNNKSYGVRVSEMLWENKVFNFGFNGMNSILDFLKKKHEKNSNLFFDKYGGEYGDYRLGLDLFKCNLHEGNMEILHELTESGSTLENLLEIRDDRFKSNWQPRKLSMNCKTAEEINTHLLFRYIQHPENFLNVYGSEIGPIILSKEFFSTYGEKIDPSRISNLLEGGKFLSEIWSVEGKSSLVRWNVRPIYMSLEQAEEVMKFLRNEYNTDAQAFFEKYHSNNGTVDIIEENTGISLENSDMDAIFGNRKNLYLLLGIGGQNENYN